MAYTQLPIVEVAVDELRLDLDNYRIPIRPDDELAALRYMFASEEVVDQVKLFLRDGYFDNEVPIVVTEDGEHIVLEGNRLVSALKAIQDPALVPAQEREVQALLTRYATELPNMPTVIRVIMAPDRDAARPHLSRLHTGLSKKRWSLDQQGNYYHSVLSPAVGVDDLKSMYPDVNVIRLLRFVEIRAFLDGVKFKDKTLHDFVRSHDLAMSSFEYAYKIKDLAAAVGIVFDGYQIVPTRKTPRAIGAALSIRERDALEHLVDRFRAGTLNTRSAEFKSGTVERASLIARLLAGGKAPVDQTPEEDPDEGPEVDNPPGDDPDDEPDQGGPDGDPRDPEDDPKEPDDGSRGGKRGPNNPDTRKGFDIGGLPLAHARSNLKRRYLELRKIDVGQTPVAAAMLLRSVLEVSIKFHFVGTPQAVTGELKPCVDRLNEVYGKDRAHKSVINTIRTGPTNKAGSVNWFNAAAHDAEFPILEADAREAFRLVESVLNLLLVPYQP